MKRFTSNAIWLFLAWMPCSGAAIAEDYVYEGTWNTTNRKLDGRMTCVVTDLGDEKWRGRFYGDWQGVAFDYPVTFSGPPSKLRGAATIDGANYTWTGEMTPPSPEAPALFDGAFGGSRYAGYFQLQQKSNVTAQLRTASADGRKER